MHVKVWSKTFFAFETFGNMFTSNGKRMFVSNGNGKSKSDAVFSHFSCGDIADCKVSTYIMFSSCGLCPVHHPRRYILSIYGYALLPCSLAFFVMHNNIWYLQKSVQVTSHKQGTWQSIICQLFIGNIIEDCTILSCVRWVRLSHHHPISLNPIGWRLNIILRVFVISWLEGASSPSPSQTCHCHNPIQFNIDQEGTRPIQ